jgi:hypothetical protein
MSKQASEQTKPQVKSANAPASRYDAPTVQEEARLTAVTGGSKVSTTD